MTSRRSRAPLGVLIAAIALIAVGGCRAVQPPPPAGERTDATDVSTSGHRLRDGGDLVMGLEERGHVVTRTVGYPMGTDDLGRDVLSRIVYATRASLTTPTRG